MNRIKGEENISKGFKEAYEIREESNPPEFEVPHHSRRMRIPAITLVASCVIVLSSIIGITISSGTVDAVKEGIANTVHKVRGNDHMVSDAEYSITINDLSNNKDMEIAYDMLPNLIVEQEIMDGYVFKEIKIVRYVHGNQTEIVADSFYYDNAGNELFVSQQSSSETIGSNILGVTEEVQTKSGTIYVSENYQGVEGMTSVFYGEETDSFLINGKANSHDMLTYIKENVVDKL